MRPGAIDAYSLVDLQINKKLPQAKSMLKVGASNIFNNQVYQSYGSPSIGALYYVSVIFDGLLK
jgi:hypothetical protein